MNLNSLIILGFVLLLNYPAQSSKIIFLIVIGVLLYSAFMSLLPQLLSAYEIPQMMLSTDSEPLHLQDSTNLLHTPKKLMLKGKPRQVIDTTSQENMSLANVGDFEEIVIRVTPETATNLPALSSAIYSALNSRLLERSIPEQVIFLDKIINTVSEKLPPAVNEIGKTSDTAKPLETKSVEIAKQQEPIKSDDKSVIVDNVTK
jgi:hypothetical protein